MCTKANYTHQLTLSHVNAVKLPNESGNVLNWLLYNLSVVNAVNLPNESGNVDN